MGFLCKLLFTTALLLFTLVKTTWADAMVSGTVFCDQCKDGEISLFDYPLYGAKVRMACPGGDGQMTVWNEMTTNWFGNYAVRISGSPDLSHCSVQVVGGSSSGCGAVAGPARGLNLFFRMFDMETYTADMLLSQPAQPMSFCQNSGLASPPSLGTPPSPAKPQTPSPAAPTTPAPTIPFFEASACPYDKWTMPEYKCYWKAVNPDTKVAVAFGLAAARRYGTDMSIWQGLRGRGDLYRTLLREATTSLLNSYNSIHFEYPTLSVVYHMNMALLGTPQEALRTAMRFKRANSGSGNVHCNFTPCK